MEEELAVRWDSHPPHNLSLRLIRSQIGDLSTSDGCTYITSRLGASSRETYALPG